LHLDSHQSYVL
ncbi:hypothetical protein TIFTF001_020248, partial [Ficus carica]